MPASVYPKKDLISRVYPYFWWVDIPILDILNKQPCCQEGTDLSFVFICGDEFVPV